MLMLAMARQWRIGRTRVGTEHLLLTMSERMPSLRPVRAGVSDRVWNPATGWRSEDAGADFTLIGDAREVDGALREAAWLARVRLRRAWEAPAPRWSAGVRAAVGRALLEGARWRVPWAHAAHLLTGVCQGGGDRAVEMLRDLRADPQGFVQRVTRVARTAGTPMTAGADLLEKTGTLTAPPVGPLRRPVLRLLTTFMRADAVRYRPGAYRPMVMAMDREAVRQVVRTGAGQATQAHLLLGLLELHQQLAASGQRLRPRWAAHNEAGELLLGAGVRRAALLDRIGRGVPPDEPLPPHSRPWRNRTPADPPFGRGVADVDRRAHAFAAELRHRYAGTSHLLMALLAEPDSPARSILRDCGVGVDQLVDRLARSLGLPAG